MVESRAHGKPTRHETHFVWQGLRLLQEQDINTGKYQTYCCEEHGSSPPRRYCEATQWIPLLLASPRH
ncbi:hypothetical protein ACVBU9_001945 [Providencia stuartii]